MNSELTPRQWALYNLLKNNPDRTFKQIDIFYSLLEWYPWTESKNFHDSTARLAITADLRAINNSEIIQKIIISNKSGVKLASEAEFAKYIDGQFAAIFRKLERTRKKAKKAGLNGQMRTVFGNERDTIEAFSDSIGRLKAMRLARGLTLSEVAEEVKARGIDGVDVPLLSKIERGIVEPTKDLLAVFAQIYALSDDLSADEWKHAPDVIA